ncbi:CAP domain-containing protein [Allofranklinella schreckenbergeri]|uniref:CAP domain-containing protein n=1 Tax=Allofranklinella schreckenbergeri TaxID=1076744 RepID=A0A3M6Q1M6_9BURK|nr:CAP domain-containing protein [Allofranklinella schreckenbergeri]RMW96208.1 CAP domain-containing protein [Allofranklinella schreckenbergeri]
MDAAGPPCMGAAALAALLLAGCGGGWEDDSPPAQQEIEPLWAQWYASPPDAAQCRPGVLHEAVKQQALDKLNAIRALHGLRPVVYDADSDAQLMQTVMMMQANQATSHHPPSSWACYSEAGASGARASNLASWQGVRSAPSADWAMHSWLHDATNLVPDNVGHRRWMLDPFLKKVAYGIDMALRDGRWHSYAALKVIYEDEQARTDGWARDGFVAYPVGDYPLRHWHENALLSFGVLADANDRGANQAVDFGQATVRVTRPDGSALPISEWRYDNRRYGLPNNVQFKAEGVTHGVAYTVHIDGVLVQGVPRNYSYRFRLQP